MKCNILHESKGRMRIRLAQAHMTMKEADALEHYLMTTAGVFQAKVYERTASAIIHYNTNRAEIVAALGAFYYANTLSLAPQHTSRALNREYEDKLISAFLIRGIMQTFVPMPLVRVVTVIRAFKYIKKGIVSLFKGKLDVDVLDAAAIAVPIIQTDYPTANSIMFLLNLGDTLEEWTHKRSVNDLARSMALNVDKVWVKTPQGEVLKPVGEIAVGEHIVVRTGNLIPLDGKVISGEALVNQASMTGESLPVRKEEGSYAYAGTVVEEGECWIAVDKNAGSGRYDRIVQMIDESEKLKSPTENWASSLADRLVPYSLGGTLLTYALTGSITKALTILMVDFSCALKLSMPLAVLSAMRESSGYSISIKGGRYLETVSKADTIVFDKTGTLTHATPKVVEVIPFGGRDENEMLRLAACLEEHYPHSMANAVVEAAVERNLQHEEHHTSVEYIVAHGISSQFGGEKVIIGSHHFVFQDEGSIVEAEDQQRFNQLPEDHSLLYMAISGKLAAVIAIDDPIREEAPKVIDKLREMGVAHIVMMTGDSEKAARTIAAQVGVDEYHAEVLPEDKANFIAAQQEKGRTVLMIGDGINDSLALSQSDCGIAISDGAQIAREIADITILADDLYELVTLKDLSDRLMNRVNQNFRFIIGFNGMLIVAGLIGWIQPSTSAMLHNASTLGVSMKSMANLIA